MGERDGPVLMQGVPARDESNVYGSEAIGTVCEGCTAQARCLLETGNITTFDIGETDEKNVWFGSGKSVCFCGGSTLGSDDVGVQ